MSVKVLDPYGRKMDDPKLLGYSYPYNGKCSIFILSSDYIGET